MTLSALPASQPVKVAIVSLLFNWPLTGGGNMHTAGLAQFLAARAMTSGTSSPGYPSGGSGGSRRRCESGRSHRVRCFGLERGRDSARYRLAVEQFDPDYVIITDAWNMKPLLAEAMDGYPVPPLIQAQENFCPLNNLRLLADGPTPS